MSDYVRCKVCGDMAGASPCYGCRKAGDYWTRQEERALYAGIGAMFGIVATWVIWLVVYLLEKAAS